MPGCWPGRVMEHSEAPLGSPCPGPTQAILAGIPGMGRLPCQRLAHRLKSGPEANTAFLPRALSCLGAARELGNLIGLISWPEAAHRYAKHLEDTLAG